MRDRAIDRPVQSRFLHDPKIFLKDERAVDAVSQELSPYATISEVNVNLGGCCNALIEKKAKIFRVYLDIANIC